MPFAEDYKSYLMAYGGISALGVELTGLRTRNSQTYASSIRGISWKNNVVSCTLNGRKENAMFPKDMYVVSIAKYSSNYCYLQNQSGTIFRFDSSGTLTKTDRNLAEHIFRISHNIIEPFKYADEFERDISGICVCMLERRFDYSDDAVFRCYLERFVGNGTMYIRFRDRATDKMIEFACDQSDTYHAVKELYPVFERLPNSDNEEIFKKNGRQWLDVHVGAYRELLNSIVLFCGPISIEGNQN